MAALESGNLVIVVTGGDPVDPAHLPQWPAGALVIAADSGIDRALELGLSVDVAIGDFDSVRPGSLRRVTSDGATVEQHPAAKDATDLELAIDAALRYEPSQVLVIGGHGGRLDHLLANAMLLAAPAYATLSMVAQMGAARVTVIRDHARLTGPVGDLVTLLALLGGASGIRTEGLLYPLRDEALLPGSTRGVSNELISGTASVRIATGVVVAIQPGQIGTHHQMAPS